VHTALPFFSNQRYPDRVNTVRLGVLQGSLQLGFDFASNLGSEFWPDLKWKILHRRLTRSPRMER
jgi:hypothetical protein